MPFAGFGRGWVVLPKAQIGSPGEPPVVIDIVLLHARRGVALLEAPPHWTPDAPRRLRRRLEQAQFSAIYPGYLPIVHAQLLRGALSELPRVLAAAFEAEPPLGLPGGDAWMRAAGRALATVEPARPPVPPVPPPHHRVPPTLVARGAGALALAALLGLGVLALQPDDPSGDAALLAGADAALPPPAEAVAPPVLPPPPPPVMATPAVLRLAPDLKGPHLAGGAALPPPGPSGPDTADPELLDVLRSITVRTLPHLAQAGSDAVAVEAPDLPDPPAGPAAVPHVAVPVPPPSPDPAAADVSRLGLPEPPPLPDVAAMVPAMPAPGADPPAEPPAPAPVPPAVPMAAPASEPAPPAPADPRPAAQAAASPAEPILSRAVEDRAAALPDRAAIAPAAAPPAAAAPGHRAPDPALLAALLQRGDTLMATGDVSGARRFYERAAEAGSPDGARAAGRTHDPAVLASLGVRGIRPDPEAASAWYRRAEALAAAEARQ